MDDLQLRHHIYRTIADTGRVPMASELADLLGGAAQTAERLAALDDRHFLVLDDDGEISMALPFAAKATGHRVVAAHQQWWANCAWDSLAIPAALNTDATVEATWLDDGTPVDLRIENGRPVGDAVDGWIHFTIPAHTWWDDIVET